MRTIGIIGGMSWESAAIYYRILNEAVKERFGGHHSARTLMYRVDFAGIKRSQHKGRWEETAAFHVPSLTLDQLVLVRLQVRQLPTP